MKIIILSRNVGLYSTQSLIKAAYRRNHEVRVLDHVACDLILDKGSTIIEYDGFDVGNSDAIIPRIGSSVTSLGAALIRQFELSGKYCLTTSQALMNARDKFRSLQILNAHDIPIPKTIVPNFQHVDRLLLEDEFSTPMIIKLIESTHGNGVIISDSYENAVSTIEAFYMLKKKILVQEFIKESRGTDIRAFVVGDRVVASMKRIASSGNFRSNLHQGGSAEKVALSREEIDTALKATKLLGLKVAGVDMLRGKNKSFIIEVNASPGLEGIETTTGVDVAGEIISFIERDIKN